MSRSRSGFIFVLAGAPLFWQSTLQTVISLSKAESELIALLEAAQILKSVMYLLDALLQEDIETLI